MVVLIGIDCATQPRKVLDRPGFPAPNAVNDPAEVVRVVWWFGKDPSANGATKEVVSALVLVLPPSAM